jgi:integrative and conjugative element protein (TIGR02256 family)
MDDTRAGEEPAMPRVRNAIGTLFLPEKLFAQIVDDAVRHSPLETGGILMGISRGEDVWVEALVSAGPNAIRGKSAFVPDHAYQLQAVADAYRASGRKLEYLGDWHSHPRSPAYMSSQDCDTLRRISNDAAARQPRPVMLIIGDGEPWVVGAWRSPARTWLRRLGKERPIAVEIGEP